MRPTADEATADAEAEAKAEALPFSVVLFCLFLSDGLRRQCFAWTTWSQEDSLSQAHAVDITASKGSGTNIIALQIKNKKNARVSSTNPKPNCNHEFNLEFNLTIV